MLLLNTTTTNFIVDLRIKKKPRKQQDVVRKEERTNTHTQAVSATQTVQRCANKLAKSRKEESERERERKCTKE